MLEKPDIQDQLISTRVQEEYGLQVAEITFQPLGADVDTAVYRVETEQGTTYFLKLRKGVFDQTSVTVPQFLHSQVLQAVIPPLETRVGRLWGNLDAYKLILFPFIEEKDDPESELADQQWIEFGAALKGIHNAQVPPSLKVQLLREVYSPDGRESVKAFQKSVEHCTFDEPVAARLAASTRLHRPEIDHLVRRAEELAQALQARPLEFVLCHSDVHTGNLLIGADGALHIVDWDNPILAPRERDLMFIGGGVGYGMRSAVGESLFDQGYGSTEVDKMALAYYRYERIVQDIAEFCKQLLLNQEGCEDREQSYQWFTSSFKPGHEIEIARKTDRF